MFLFVNYSVNYSVICTVICSAKMDKAIHKHIFYYATDGPGDSSVKTNNYLENNAHKLWKQANFVIETHGLSNRVLYRDKVRQALMGKKIDRLPALCSATGEVYLGRDEIIKYCKDALTPRAAPAPHAAAPPHAAAAQHAQHAHTSYDDENDDYSSYAATIMLGGV